LPQSRRSRPCERSADVSVCSFGTRKALPQRPRVHHHVEPFAKACLGLPDRDAEANELVAPLALANASFELATEEKIDGRRLLGEHASSRLSSAAQR
jgi:hypothetical protein